MGQLEESSELTLDFTKLEKVGKQVADSRAAAVEHDPGVIPVAVQNADTKEVILVAYTNEYAMKESFAKRKLILWSTSRNKLWFKGETSGETFDLLEAYVNCEQNSPGTLSPSVRRLVWAGKHQLGNAAWGASFPSERALPAGGFGSVHTPSP